MTTLQLDGYFGLTCDDAVTVRVFRSYTISR